MTTGHLVQECGEAISAALDKVEAVELLYLSPAEKAEGLKQLARLESRVAAARLRLLAVADEVAEQTGGSGRGGLVPARDPDRPRGRPAATWRWRGRWTAGGPSWRPRTRVGTCRPRRPM